MHRCIGCRQVFMKSVELTVPATRIFPARRGAELAFLPAALELVETPPSPIGQAIGASIVLLFCAALVWTLM